MTEYTPPKAYEKIGNIPYRYDELDPICHSCIKTNCATKDGPIANGKAIYKAGDFAIDCRGIPLDPEYQGRKSLEDRKGIVLPDDSPLIPLLGQKLNPAAWAAANIQVFDKESGVRGPFLTRGASAENIVKYSLPETSDRYQEAMIRCTARRSVYRCGRRLGKTWTLIAKIAYKMFSTDNVEVMVIAPSKTQVETIFDLLLEFIDQTPELAKCLVNRRKSPHYYIDLTNGAKMTGYVSGSDAVRGKRCDIMVVDEADYIHPDTMAALMPILTEHQKTELYVASTPSGARAMFYTWDHDETYRSFWYPSMCRPNWDDRMEVDSKKPLTQLEFLQEFWAYYGSLGSGVFQTKYIDKAEADYQYSDVVRNPSKRYLFGVDWNPQAGTQVTILERQFNGSLKVVQREVCERFGKKQIEAVEHIIDLNRTWEPEWIYVDKGAGDVQIEMLHKAGSQGAPGSADARLEHIVKSVEFGAKDEYTNPVTGGKIKQYVKPMMVNNLVRYLENGMLIMSEHDEELSKQMRNYIIEKVSNSRIVYGRRDAAIPDHALDSLMIAAYAQMMEHSELGLANHSNEVDLSSFEDLIEDEDTAWDYTYRPNVPKQTKSASELYRKALEQDEVFNPTRGELRPSPEAFPISQASSSWHQAATSARSHSGARNGETFTPPSGVFSRPSKKRGSRQGRRTSW